MALRRILRNKNSTPTEVLEAVKLLEAMEDKWAAKYSKRRTKHSDELPDLLKNSSPRATVDHQNAIKMGVLTTSQDENVVISVGEVVTDLDQVAKTS